MMKSVSFAALTLALAAIAQPALADHHEEAAQVEVARGQSIYDANGRRLGKVYKVSDEGDVQIILSGRFINIPVATISDVDGKLTTSMERKDFL